MSVRKIGIYAASGVLWLSISAVCDYYLGTNSAVFILLGIFTIGAVFQVSRNWLHERAISAIDPADDRPVRFDGTAEQAKIASELAIVQGWIVEELPPKETGEVSIRFKPGEQATPARDFVRSLFDVDIAGKVCP